MRSSPPHRATRARLVEAFRSQPAILYVSLVPVVALFGVAFGVAAVQASVPLAAAVVMSATTFAGAGQFTAVTVFGQDNAVLAAALAGIAVNLRYLPMGAAVAHRFAGSRMRRFLEAQTMIDESWSIAHTPHGFDRYRLIVAGGVLYLSWVAGTTIGAAIGTAVDTQALGLDAAIGTLFAALLLPMMTTTRRRAIAGGAALLTIGALALLPLGLALLVGAAAAIVGDSDG